MTCDHIGLIPKFLQSSMWAIENSIMLLPASLWNNCDSQIHQESLSYSNRSRETHCKTPLERIDFLPTYGGDLVSFATEQEHCDKKPINVSAMFGKSYLLPLILSNKWVTPSRRG